jgi:glycine oxidase
VGQGLAGSLLAYFLLKKGHSVVVIDSDTEGGASKIAAGIINPITGKRFVKSWRIDAFLPIARTTYKALETLLQIPIWQERVMIRTLKSVEEENQWLLRSGYEDYLPYCSDTIATLDSSDETAANVALRQWGKHLKILQKYPSLAIVQQAAQVNVPAFIECFKQYLMSLNAFFLDNFDYQNLDIAENGVSYRDFKAEKIIFCEGAKAIKNPYFNALPFNPDKGELLIVKIPHFNLTQLFKHHITIAPLGDDLYWVGATNDWHFESDNPTEVNKQIILSELREILNMPFEIVAHQAAVRPTVKDRRPFIGFHPDYPTLAIFNGFGTKGASLIPYWANYFSAILSNAYQEEVTEKAEQSSNLDKEIDIKRYEKLLKKAI